VDRWIFWHSGEPVTHDVVTSPRQGDKCPALGSRTLAIVAGVGMLGVWGDLLALHLRKDDLWYQGDSLWHAANGLFWSAFLARLPVHPLDFALTNYARYPVISPTAWPPGLLPHRGCRMVFNGVVTTLGRTLSWSRGRSLCRRRISTPSTCSGRRWQIDDSGSFEHLAFNHKGSVTLTSMNRRGPSPTRVRSAQLPGSRARRDLPCAPNRAVVLRPLPAVVARIAWTADPER
jgi:hypothetical protein